MALNLIDFINNKTEGRFHFLKLSEVIYFTKLKKCFVSFIYPQSQDDLSESDKEKIVELTTRFLDVKGKVEVKIRKSYMDENLIYKSCMRYFEENAKSIVDNFNQDTVFVEVDGEIATISILTNRHISDYMAQKNVKTELISYLNINYCGNFIVNIKEEIPDENNDEFLKERQRRIEEISYATAYANNQNRRFGIGDVKHMFGDEIDVMPEHIVDGEAENRVFAGKIRYLTMRSFSKVKKNKKTGEDETIEKQYFTFMLQDGNKSINATYFPTKATLHKMTLLSDGMTVVIKGDVKLFREKFSITVKALSLCTVLSDEEQKFKKSVSQYMFVCPEPYITTNQNNLFEKPVEQEIPERAKGKTFVIFDLETTGLSPESDEIIEIGAVKIVNGILKETFACFVKPSFPIPAEATAINNITNEMVKDAYSINQVFPDFYKFCEGATLVGHNAIDFDCKFIDNIAKKMGYKMTDNRMDTLMMSRAKLSHLKFHNLKTICGYLGIELIGAHRAVNDTIATAQVFLKLL